MLLAHELSKLNIHLQANLFQLKYSAAIIAISQATT